MVCRKNYALCAFVTGLGIEVGNRIGFCIQTVASLRVLDGGHRGDKDIVESSGVCAFNLNVLLADCVQILQEQPRIGLSTTVKFKSPLPKNLGGWRAPLHLDRSEASRGKVRLLRTADKPVR
jgi:hypothetical protein